MASSFENREIGWLVAGGVGALVFVVALASVLAHGGILAWDAPAASDVAGVPLQLGKAGEVLGGTVVVAIVIIGTSLYLASKRRWWSVARIAGLTVAGEAAVQITKRLVARPRPVNPFEVSYSFPSGHATNAAIMACLLVWFAFSARRGRVVVLALVAIALAWAVAIALSRVVYGVHYFSDVLGAAGLGTAVGGVGLALLARAERLHPDVRPWGRSVAR